MKAILLLLVTCLILSCSLKVGDDSEAEGIGNTVIVTWNPNAELDLMGYKVHYGKESGNYTTISDVGNVTQYAVYGYPDSTWFFTAVTAYDTARNESGYSNEGSVYVVNKPPAAPTGCSCVQKQ